MSLRAALVAQLDRASASGAEGHRFESCRARKEGPRPERRGPFALSPGPSFALPHGVPYRSLRWRELIPGAAMLGVLAATTAATLKYARIGSLHGDTVHYYASFASARN